MTCACGKAESCDGSRANLRNGSRVTCYRREESYSSIDDSSYHNNNSWYSNDNSSYDSSSDSSSDCGSIGD